MPVSRIQINGLLSLLGKAVAYCHPVTVGAMKNEMFDQSAFDLTGTEFSSTCVLPDKLCSIAEMTWFSKHDLGLVTSLVLSLQGHQNPR